MAPRIDGVSNRGMTDGEKIDELFDAMLAENGVGPASGRGAAAKIRRHGLLMRSRSAAASGRDDPNLSRGDLARGSAGSTSSRVVTRISHTRSGTRPASGTTSTRPRMGAVFPHHSEQIKTVDELKLTAGGEDVQPPALWSGTGDRADRLRQVHHVGRHHRSHQREPAPGTS